MVRNDRKLDDSAAADLAMLNKDDVSQTPTLVIESKGKRQTLARVPSFSVLKSYLDQLLE
jgi:hypothetical protein